MTSPDDASPHDAGTPRRRFDPAWNDWNPPRRWPGILLSCVVVLAFFGIVIWHLRPHSSIHHPQVHFHAVHQKLPFVPGTNGAHAAAFAGAHSANNLQFVSNGGLLILHDTCVCDYNFVVTIENSSLIPVAFPVNTSGNYNTVLNVAVPAGLLHIAVVGHGHWFLQLIQPTPHMPSLATPFKYFSAGDDMLGPFSAANRHLAFKFFSLSNGSVFVHVVTEQGVRVLTPFLGRTSLSLSANIAALPNPYFIEVDASGFWNLTVQR